jgi:hypothetical protein
MPDMRCPVASSGRVDFRNIIASLPHFTGQSGRRRASSARDAGLTGGRLWLSAISAAPNKAYFRVGDRVRVSDGTGQMVHSSRLHHDVELAQRATLGLAVGIVLGAFLLLAAGATVYDVGKWLTIW